MLVVFALRLCDTLVLKTIQIPKPTLDLQEKLSQLSSVAHTGPKAIQQKRSSPTVPQALCAACPTEIHVDQTSHDSAYPKLQRVTIRPG